MLFYAFKMANAFLRENDVHRSNISFFIFHPCFTVLLGIYVSKYLKGYSYPSAIFETTLFMDGSKGAEIFYLVVVDGEAIISFSFYVKAGTTGYFYLAVYTNSSEILIWAVIIVLPKVHDLFIWTCRKVTWI